MWIFLPSGFFSIVQHPRLKSLMLVRARRREHLQNACERGGFSRRIKITPDRDYRYRITVTRVAVQDWIAKEIASIDYSNFKEAAHSGDAMWNFALGSVWDVMYELQERARPSDLLMDVAREFSPMSDEQARIEAERMTARLNRPSS